MTQTSDIFRHCSKKSPERRKAMSSIRPHQLKHRSSCSSACCVSGATLGARQWSWGSFPVSPRQVWPSEPSRIKAISLGHHGSPAIRSCHYAAPYCPKYKMRHANSSWVPKCAEHCTSSCMSYIDHAIGYTYGFVRRFLT